MASNKEWEEVPLKDSWEEVPIESNDGINVGDVAKKFAQGISYGFLPRIAGGMETAGQAIGIKGLGSPDISDIGFQKPELLEPEKLKENYLQAKKAYEESLDKASERSPVASNIAEFAGGVMAPIPGAKAATLTGKALKGAGLGAVAGYGYSRDDDEKLGRMTTGGVLGAVAPIVAEKVFEPVVKYSGKQAGKLKDTLSKWGDQFKTMPKENMEQITKASKELGFEPTRAMLSDSKQIAALEEGLTKGGGFVSTPYVEQSQNIQEGIKKGLGKIGEKQTASTAIETGEEIAKRLSSEIDNMTAPVKELYQSITKDLQKIPVNVGVIKSQIGALKRNDLFRNDQGRAFLERIESEVSETSDIASLNNYISDFFKQRSPMASGRENAFIDATYGALKNIRDNSLNILKNDEFVKQAGKGGHAAVDAVIDTLTLAEKQYATNITDINAIRSILGSSKEFGSPTAFSEKLSEQSFEKIGKQAGGSSVETLQRMKKNFPTVFEKAKEQKINDLIKSSETKGEMDLGKFIKNVKRLSPEMRDLLFDKESNDLISNLETVYNSLPGPINPSGTSTMQRMWQSFSSPLKWASDYAASKALKTATPEGSPFANKLTNFVGEVESSMKPGGKIFEAPRRSLETIPRVIQPLISTDKKDVPDQSSIMDKVKGSKYEQVLQNALKNGGDSSFAAANYVLKNRDNNYRKLFNEEA